MFYSIRRDNKYLVMNAETSEIYWGSKKDRMYFSSVEQAEKFAYRLMFQEYEVEEIEVYA